MKLPKKLRFPWLAACGLLLLAGCAATPEQDSVPCEFDVIIRGGTIYDGSGGTPHIADVGIRGERIATIGNLQGRSATVEVDATGRAVAPGFINVLSWATESLIEDPRSLADIRQGVTLEVFGEGWSMGPLNETMRRELGENQFGIRYEVEWSTLGGYLEFLAKRGVAPNVASFVGATTVRIHEIGHADRPPTEDELARMCELVRAAMRDGALGVGSSLIYAPAFYAETPELIALCKAAAEYGGRYITHMRSEGDRLLEGVEEVIEIARESGIGAEIYHLKAAGTNNWSKLEEVITRIEEVRSAGLDLTANMYTYTAGATGLNAAMPPWVQEGGHDAWVARLRDPEIRARVIREMETPSDEWENLLLAAGSAERVLLVSFKNAALRPLIGKSLAEAAALRGKSAAETAIELVIEDDTRVGTVYFLMSEENVRRQVTLPWVAFGSDAGSPAPEGVFLDSNPHPRAYGNFARLLGLYVRDEGLVPLEEAIRRMTSFPADNLGIEERGSLTAGYYADVVIFDPATIQDHATFAEPHQLATGVGDVFVNGVQVLKDSAPTGELPGQVVRGPGYRGQ